MRHRITSVIASGITAFPDARIAEILVGLTGSSVPESRTEAARQALVDLYRSAGYVYTTANALLAGTTLRLQVIEGHIADVKLDGDVGPAATQVRASLIT
jgi:hemolysin activation/secretion protein